MRIRNATHLTQHTYLFKPINARSKFAPGTHLAQFVRDDENIGCVQEGTTEERVNEMEGHGAPDRTVKGYVPGGRRECTWISAMQFSSWISARLLHEISTVLKEFTAKISKIRPAINEHRNN